MRFRASFQSIVLIVASLYIVHLGINNNLDLYIHPRYINFTITMALIGLLLLSINFIYVNRQKESHRTSKIALAPLGAILIFALFVPAKSLTSATVSQRETDAGSIVATNDSKPVSTLFAGSSRALKLADWSRLLSSNGDENYYTNKPAKVSGFIYDAGLGTNVVWIARFIVKCCAVDAQPIGVPIYIKDWENLYEQDQWIEVEGEFLQKSTDNGTQLVLEPTKVTEIEQPRNPYAE